MAKRGKFDKALLLSIIILFVMGLFSQTLGLSQSGFDKKETLEQFFFFLIAGSAFMMAIWLAKAYEYRVRDGDAKYGDSVVFHSPGHTPALPMFKDWSILRYILTFTLLFGGMGIFNFFVTQTVFTGVGALEQAFSPVTSILFSSALVPASENLGSHFLIAFSIVMIRIFARKIKMDAKSFQLTAILIPTILVAIYGLANHQLRYSGQDASLIVVIFFWAIGGLITVLTGSFIPFWLMHIFNNLFYDLRRFAAADDILTGSIIMLVLLGLLYIYLYFIRKKK